MSRTGLKKMLVAGVAIFGLSLCAAQANAGWWWGAPPCCGGCGWDCGCAVACVPSYSCCSGWCGCGCHHRACRWGCGYDCGCGCSVCCDPCWTACSCCGTTVASWGTPVVSGCGCGTVTGTFSGGQYTTEPAGTPTPAAAPTAPGTPAKAEPAKAESPAAAPVAPVAPSTTTPVAPERPLLPGGGSGAPVPPEGPGIPIPKSSSTSDPTAGESGLLTVWVPNEAKVTINGMLTKSTGSKRHFVSYGLRPGFAYKYVVKAEIVREGKIVTEEQTVSLTSGAQTGVAFGFNNYPSTENLAATE